MVNLRIFCVAYGGGHIRACLPALHELRNRGWHIDLLALTTAFDEAKRAGFDAWRVQDFVKDGDEVMLARGVELARAFRESAAVPRKETAAYLAFGYHDLVAAHGQTLADEIYEARGRFAFAPRTLAIRAIERAQPDVVLTTNSPRAEKAVIDIAQERGVPAILLNDLVASDSNYWLHDPTYADRILVLNNYVRDRLIASGHSPEKLVVTGNPAFEPMIALRAQRATRSSYDRKVILYASQQFTPSDWAHGVEMRSKLHSIAESHKDWEIRIRLHPNEISDAGWIKPPLRHFSGTSLMDDLRSADVVVTNGSSVGLEAAIAGIPTVLQLGSSVSASVRYDEMNIAIAAPDFGALEDAIAKAIKAGTSPSVAMPADPAQRVADAIEDYLNAV